MMTREQYIMRKADIEAQMKQTRRDEQNEVKAVNEQYELRLQDENNEHRRRRQAIFDERDAARLEVESHYKDLRRALWSQDVQLVEEWRAGLRRDEVQITPPPYDGRPYVRLCDGRPNEGGTEQ